MKQEDTLSLHWEAHRFLMFTQILKTDTEYLRRIHLCYPTPFTHPIR